jgi:hypothetical protein
MLFAVLDGLNRIEPRHLHAAMAVWRYSVESACYIFGATKFSPLAVKFEEALKDAGPRGLPMKAIRKVAGSNAVPTKQIRSALGELRSAGRARMKKEPGTKPGRSPEVWRHITHVLSKAPDATGRERGTIGTIGNNGGKQSNDGRLFPTAPIGPDDRLRATGELDGDSRPQPGDTANNPIVPIVPAANRPNDGDYISDEAGIAAYALKQATKNRVTGNLR